LRTSAEIGAQASCPYCLTIALRMIPQAVPPLLPPLLHLAPGCVPLGQGSIVLDLVSQADKHDRRLHRDGCPTGLQPFVAGPEREVG
jgi:hypothetical protein